MWFDNNNKNKMVARIFPNGSITTFTVKDISSAYFICSTNDPDLNCTEPFVSLCMDTVICHRHWLNGTNAPINKHDDAKTACSNYKGFGMSWTSKPINHACKAKLTNYNQS